MFNEKTKIISCCCNGTCESGTAPKKESFPQKKAYLRALVSFVLLGTGMALPALGIPFFDNKWVLLAWYVAAYLPVGIPVALEAWESMLEKDVFSEYTLMCLATIGAFAIGEYPEAVAVMLFYAVGELFQESAVSRAKRNISALLDVRPETARVVEGDALKEVSPEHVRVGALVEVKVGERVPLDGVLRSPSAAFNTAALTGESMPRTIREGEEVLAGMIATDGVSRIEVSKPFGQSALARILELVQNATARKAPAEKLIRKFARIYTPVVVALATLIALSPWIYSLVEPGFTYIFSDWLYRGLVFLVISCPCALVISVPLGYFGGIGAASRHGILFKGGNYLEAITKINAVVMDKTGTLTQGVFSVQKTVAAGNVSDDELVGLIASVETQSTHPIARAVVEHANRRGIGAPKSENVREIAGYGMEAVVGTKKILVGNVKLLVKNQIEFPRQIAAIPETIVACAVDGVYAGYVMVADAPKKDAAIGIESLKSLGIGHLAILSGDKQEIVSKLAGELGIPNALGDLLPEGKVAYVERLKQDRTRRIAFVGDGINDAPVLAMSDVGIAMGGLGSDVAVETADVIIQTDKPGSIATAIKIGKATRRVVVQNIGFAFAVKLIVLLLGAGGIATLWEAVFADVGVSLLAILNAVRILKMRFLEANPKL
ncbi:MAG: heavy metal translocating P-type ATPase [Breznakibacter sp.]